MSKSLLDGEAQDIYCSTLDRICLGKRSFQDWFEVALYYSRANAEATSVNIEQSDNIQVLKAYPESANPSVFPINSSILTSSYMVLAVVAAS